MRATMRPFTLATAMLVLVLGAGRASADVIINFEELDPEAGIHLGGFDNNGNPIDVTKLGSETFHLSSPQIPGGYPADATLSHIGISLTSDYFLVNILESPGGPLSDQVYVHRLSGIFTVIDFISDPDPFVTGVTPTSTIVETGNLQLALTYFNDRGESVTINIRSDVEAVPEPSTLLGCGLIAVALAGYRLRRRKAA